MRFSGRERYRFNLKLEVFLCSLNMGDEGDSDLISDAESSDDDKSIKGTKHIEQNFFRYKI